MALALALKPDFLALALALRLFGLGLEFVALALNALAFAQITRQSANSELLKCIESEHFSCHYSVIAVFLENSESYSKLKEWIKLTDGHSAIAIITR